MHILHIHFNMESTHLVQNGKNRLERIKPHFSMDWVFTIDSLGTFDLIVNNHVFPPAWLFLYDYFKRILTICHLNPLGTLRENEKTT